MHRIYSFSDYDYVCFHQVYCDKLAQNYDTIVGYTKNHQIPCIKPFPISAYEIASLIAQLKSRSTSHPLLVIDMRKIMHSPIHSLKTVIELLAIEKYQGILYIIEDDLLAKLLDQEYSSLQRQYSFQTLGSSTKLIANQNFTLSNSWNAYIDQIEKVDRDIAYYIFSALKSTESQPMEKLRSSNVYINRYFNAKSSLVNGDDFHLIVYSMARMLETVLNELVNRDFDAFICASITGACFASALSVFFRKPVIYLKNIGPSMSANDERMIERIRKSTRYVYVFDFICMGSEFDRMRMICDIRLAKIVANIGISYFRFPHFETIDKKAALPFDWDSKSKIAVLFQINAFEKDYYNCAIENEMEG